MIISKNSLGYTDYQSTSQFSRQASRQAAAANMGTMEIKITSKDLKELSGERHKCLLEPSLCVQPLIQAAISETPLT